MILFVQAFPYAVNFGREGVQLLKFLVVVRKAAGVSHKGRTTIGIPIYVLLLSKGETSALREKINLVALLGIKKVRDGIFVGVTFHIEDGDTIFNGHGVVLLNLIALRVAVSKVDAARVSREQFNLYRIVIATAGCEG